MKRMQGKVQTAVIEALGTKPMTTSELTMQIYSAGRLRTPAAFKPDSHRPKGLLSLGYGWSKKDLREKAWFSPAMGCNAGFPDRRGCKFEKNQDEYGSLD